jgi:hypothetical protein
MLPDKISYSIIEDFIKKVRVTSKSKQRTIVIPTDEAESLVYHLNLVLLKLLDKQQTAEINKKPEDEVITIMMDGGGLDESR